MLCCLSRDNGGDTPLRGININLLLTYIYINGDLYNYTLWRRINIHASNCSYGLDWIACGGAAPFGYSALWRDQGESTTGDIVITSYWPTSHCAIHLAPCRVANHVSVKSLILAEKSCNFQVKNAVSLKPNALFSLPADPSRGWELLNLRVPSGGNQQRVRAAKSRGTIGREPAEGESC